MLGSRAGRATTLVALTAALAVAGCGGGPPAPRASDSLAVPEYQVLLTGVEQAVPPAIVRIAGATTTQEIAAARVELAQLAGRQEYALRSVLPPVDVESDHAELADYLQTVATIDNSPIDAARENECGVLPSPEEQVYEVKSDIQQTLSVAAARLSTAGFTRAGLNLDAQLSFDLPGPPIEQTRRADNGAVVQRSGQRGSGRLVIDNGGGSDAVIAAVAVDGDPASPLASIYVRANSSATLNGIRGDYQVYFKSGTDWDEQTRAFTRECQFQRFDDLFEGSTGWAISITPTAGGNASSASVNPF